jgi:hypothetical protein
MSHSFLMPFGRKDWRNFYLINGALMILILKKPTPSGLMDYRPISLIHCISKLFSKELAMRLVPRMDEIIRANQTASIKGWRIHDNFRTVQLTCRWLHSFEFPAFFLKIDLAKAFDSVAWPFLLEVLQRLGFLRVGATGSLPYSQLQTRES